MLKVENLFVDTVYEKSKDMPHIKEVAIEGDGYHLYGYILTPGAEFAGKRPCVIMSHGFPGYTTNNDLEHALRRIGCVVVHVNHRGAWGSEGKYFFSNLPLDIERVYDWLLSAECQKEFQVDDKNVFLIGHSMGGMTVVNATRKLKNIKGTIAIAPYDLNYCFTAGTQKSLQEMIHEEGICLKMESEDALFEDAIQCNQKLALSAAAKDLLNRNIFFIGADCDDIAPPDKMIAPLFNQIKEYQRQDKATGVGDKSRKCNDNSDSTEYKNIQALQEYVLLHTDHSLCGSRIKLAQIIGEWIAKCALREL